MILIEIKFLIFKKNASLIHSYSSNPIHSNHPIEKRSNKEEKKESKKSLINTNQKGYELKKNLSSTSSQTTRSRHVVENEGIETWTKTEWGSRISSVCNESAGIRDVGPSKSLPRARAAHHCHFESRSPWASSSVVPNLFFFLTIIVDFLKLDRVSWLEGKERYRFFRRIIWRSAYHDSRLRKIVA